MTELYYVTSVAREYSGYKNVELIWFLREKTAQRPYADLIENYNQSSDYLANECIDEMFALDQANALKEYLDRNYGSLGTTTIEKVELPIPNNAISLGWHSGDDYESFCALAELPDYSLPFKAWGYCRLYGYEPADDSEACELADGSQGRL